MAFEVYLEFGRFRSIIECNGDLQLPWPVFSGVRNFPYVVAAQSILQIVGQAHVMPRRVDFTDQQIDVKEFHYRGVLA